MESSSQDRHLPASARKLQKARAEGQVARSRDLSHLAVLGTGSLALVAFMPLLFDHLKLVFSQQLSFNTASIRQTQDMLARLGEMTTVGLLICAGFAAITTTAVVFSTLAAGGWVFSFKPLMPDLNRLNPLHGIKGLFSKKKLLDVAKVTLITGVLIAMTALFLNNNIHSIASLVLQPSPAVLPYLSDWMVNGMGLLLLVILVIALADVPLQLLLHKSELKMSLQEQKDEHKESEGNPQIKNQIRAKQRAMAQRNSIRAVPKADFIVMNPTHFAVAIRYDEKSMSAPRVIAKGADLLAFKIRDIANAHTIPVLQSPKLARALFANAELDKDIPSSLYTAVAQVLAYVYRLRAAMRGEMPMPGDLPEPFVPPELDPLTKAVNLAPST